MIYLVSVLAFFLPFASIKGCNEKEYKTYSGFELIGEYTSLILPISLGLLFFVLSFLRRPGSPIFQGFLLSGKAVLAWLAAIVLQIWLPVFASMFGSFVPEIGLYLSATCWDLAFIVSLIGALVCLFKMRPLQAIPRAAYPKHVSLLLVANYLLSGVFVLFSFLLFGYEDTSLPRDYPHVVLWQLTWITNAVSLPFLSYFLNEGLKRGETWSGKWSIFIAGVFLLVGASLSYSVIQGDVVLWVWVLWILIPLSPSAAVALVKSIQFSLAMVSRQRR